MRGRAGVPPRPGCVMHVQVREGAGRSAQVLGQRRGRIPGLGGSDTAAAAWKARGQPL